MTGHHYGRSQLAAEIMTVLSREFPVDHRFNVTELARLDQFHTRGLAATADLARSAEVTAAMRVLDVGCGLGGPARYLASTYGCSVVGIDLSVPFIEAARTITERSAYSDNVTFEQGDALDLPFADETFDLVWMQHVAMNIADRPALYAGLRRVLRKGGRLATYDVVRGSGTMLYPVPWARDERASFLLNEDETRETLERTGFHAVSWQRETDVALEWFKSAALGSAPGGLDLTIAMGPDFPALTDNLRRNLSAGTAGILAAVLERS